MFWNMDIIIKGGHYFPEKNKKLQYFFKNV